MCFKLVISLLLSSLVNPVDVVRIQCKMKLGEYSDRAIYISKNNVCYVRNYNIYVDVDSFMSAAVRLVY